MDIQIIHDQQYLFAATVMDLHQFTQEMRKIYSCSGVRQPHDPLAGQRFKRNEQARHTTAAVLIVFASWVSRLCRDASLLSCRFVSSRQTTGRRGS